MTSRKSVVTGKKIQIEKKSFDFKRFRGIFRGKLYSRKKLYYVFFYSNILTRSNSARLVFPSDSAHFNNFYF